MPASRARRTRVALESAAHIERQASPIVAIKIGGSLMTSPHLIERIEWLVAQRSPARPLIICGGGAAADTVRRWQKLHDLSEEAAHWLAFDAVSFNERLLESALPRSVIVDDAASLENAWRDDRLPILNCDAYVREQEFESDDLLPHDWTVTGDSIAAWCATQLGAEELILAKSTDLPTETSLEKARDNGLVDGDFPRVAANLCLSWVNLQSSLPTVIEWTSPVSTESPF